MITQQLALAFSSHIGEDTYSVVVQQMMYLIAIGTVFQDNQSLNISVLSQHLVILAVPYGALSPQQRIT